MTLFALAGATLAIGVCLGISGYGGFLVPPLLVWLCGYDDPRRAVATALLAATLPALVGAAMYRRTHRTPRLLTLALCAGTVPGIALGRWLTHVASDAVLHVLIGVAVLLAGLALFARRPRPATVDAVTDDGDDSDGAASTAAHPGGRRLAAPSLGAGVLSGVAGVVVGVGGPLVTTPVLLSSGLPLTAAVGAGLANSVVVSVLGTVSLLGDVTLDPRVLLATALPQLVGVLVGVRLHARVGATVLSRVVAAVAVAVGVGFVLQVAR